VLQLLIFSQSDSQIKLAAAAHEFQLTLPVVVSKLINLNKVTRTLDKGPSGGNDTILGLTQCLKEQAYADQKQPQGPELLS
jgi:hypothetical protein